METHFMKSNMYFGIFNRDRSNYGDILKQIRTKSRISLVRADVFCLGGQALVIAYPGRKVESTDENSPVQ